MSEVPDSWAGSIGCTLNPGVALGLLSTSLHRGVMISLYSSFSSL